MFDSVASSIDHIRAGELRPLAVTGATRLDVLPDIPTVGDFVPGSATDAWTGIGAPKNTPAEMIDLLNKEINAALANPRFASRLNDLGQIAFASSQAGLRKLIADETGKWAKVIQAANIKVE